MYIPANIAPVMETTYLGTTTADTILSGVAYFIEQGDWLLAFIIFTASVLFPLLKMLILLYLLVSVQLNIHTRRRERTKLYRLTEIVGRWSMVDVFVVGILAALVQLGNLATIVPSLGIVAFAAVVVLTMLAAQSFDPRLLWDGVQRNSD